MFRMMLAALMAFPASAFALDTDGDGISDDVDNCDEDPNTNQWDYDLDGMGDICDYFPKIHGAKVTLFDERLEAIAEAARRLIAVGPAFNITTDLAELLVGECQVATGPYGATDPDGEPSRIETCWKVVNSFEGVGTYPYESANMPWGPDGPTTNEVLVEEAIDLIDGLETLKLDTVKTFVGAKNTKTDRDTIIGIYRGLAY